MPKLFLSYRRTDSEHVTGRVYDRLSIEFGRESVFKDVDSIPLGIDFREVLAKSVADCDVLLAVIGKEWLNAKDESGELRIQNQTDFVRIEIEAALIRGIPVVPILVGGAKMPKSIDLPESLKALVFRHASIVRADPDFHRDMDRLISGIRAISSHVSPSLSLSVGSAQDDKELSESITLEKVEQPVKPKKRSTQLGSPSQTTVKPENEDAAEKTTKAKIRPAEIDVPKEKRQSPEYAVKPKQKTSAVANTRVALKSVDSTEQFGWLILFTLGSLGLVTFAGYYYAHNFWQGVGYIALGVTATFLWIAHAFFPGSNWEDRLFSTLIFAGGCIGFYFADGFRQTVEFVLLGALGPLIVIGVLCYFFFNEDNTITDIVRNSIILIFVLSFITKKYFGLNTVDLINSVTKYFGF